MIETKCDRCCAVIEAKGGIFSGIIEQFEYPKIDLSISLKVAQGWHKIELCYECKKKLVEFLKMKSEGEE